MELRLNTSGGRESNLSKKAPRKNVRNILQSPYEVHWPVLNDVTKIKEMLLRLLPPLRRKTVELPWLVQKKMTKDMRIRTRKEAKAELIDDNKELRQDLICGINQFVRGIDGGTIASAILSDSIQPKFMCNSIIELAALHSVPVIIFPDLNELAQGSLGFSSSCLAIKKTASENENSYFYHLHRAIVKASEDNKLSNNALLYNMPIMKVTSKEISQLEETDPGEDPVCGTSACHDKNRSNNTISIESYDRAVQLKKTGKNYGYTRSRIAHPYLRSFVDKSPRINLSSVDIVKNIENSGLERNVDVRMDVVQEGSSSAAQGSCDQSCDRNSQSMPKMVSISSSSYSESRQKWGSTCPYKSVRIKKTAVCGESSKIKSLKK